MTAVSMIDRRTMSTGRMWVFTTHAAGPLVVLRGGIPTVFAVAAVPGVPLAFVLVTAVLALLTVGYTAMSRQVPHAAVYYAIMARGLGRPAGVAAGILALASYNAILTCMYGFLGGFLAGMLGGTWWVYALLGWVAIAAAGVRSVSVSAALLAVSLTIAAVVTALFLVAAFLHPAGGHVEVTGFSWTALDVASAGSAFTMAVASFAGYDGAASFATEAIDKAGPSRAVVRGLWTLGVAYALMAWAMSVANGPTQVIAAAADPHLQVPLNTITGAYGFLMGPVTDLLVVGGVLATILSVHQITARYGYAMARDRVLPRAVAYTGRGATAGGPVGGSALQSGISLTVITVFAGAGLDPMTSLFPWLATAGAIGLVFLLVCASLAAMRYLRGRDTVSRRLIAPGLGVAAGSVLLGQMLLHSDALLGAGPGSQLPVIIPGVLVAITLAGLGWGCYLATVRRDIYTGIAREVRTSLETVSRRLAAKKI
jgi:amino acid transporter